MREIRTSGSEGGGGDSPYPYRSNHKPEESILDQLVHREVW